MTATIHASCVAIGDRAVLISGASGSGKSDLALRLIDRGAMLVSDDYTALTLKNSQLTASAPASIKGKIEVRGIGVIDCAARDDVAVVMIIDLDAVPQRMPAAGLTTMILGIALPCFALLGHEPSAPIKVERALALLGER
jgi:serine kinase of HPr protein (carbohydrate metabolism regulator)